ncbi:MAG: hypothetical protein DRH26_02295 [Deltaproteobacteria bacterium]|nr:MAG: hypothetical protein DRH26_02295 [Deltaproteobacteria bacterium]
MNDIDVKIEPGKFYDLSSWEYHHGAGKEWLSKSILSYLLDSPRKFRHEVDNPEPLDVFDKAAEKFHRGTAFHTYFLEPEKFDSAIVTMKEFSGTGSRAARKEWQDEIRTSGLTPIKKDFQDVILTLKKMIHSGAHETARGIIEGPDNFTEKSGFWIDEETGMQFKIRPDLIQSDKTLWDIKTHASVKSFQRQAMDLNYDLQAAMYLNGVSAITGIEHNSFGFIVFHIAEPPYNIETLICSDEFLASGREKFDRIMAQYMACAETGEWPGRYPDDIETLYPTRWRTEQLENSPFAEFM